MLRSAVFAVVVLMVAACSAGTAPPIATPTSGPTSAPTPAPTVAPTLGGTPAASPTLAPTTGPTAEVCGTDWFTSPGECGGEIGDQFVFQCPPGGHSTAIYGTDTYTDDSAACVAAVHAGLINFEAGGAVTVELRPGLSAYVGSTRYGVDSGDWNSWPTSFVFIGGATPLTTPPPSGSMAALLAHVPAAFNVNCSEVTSMAAGAVVSAQCQPDIVTGYVAYTLFDTSDHLRDRFLDDLDFFGQGVEPGADCSAGPCLVEYVRDGSIEGRLFANNYTGIDPTGLISYWMDDGLLIEANLAVYNTTFAQLYDLALQAGPTP